MRVPLRFARVHVHLFLILDVLDVVLPILSKTSRNTHHPWRLFISSHCSRRSTSRLVQLQLKFVFLLPFPCPPQQRCSCSLSSSATIINSSGCGDHNTLALASPAVVPELEPGPVFTNLCHQLRRCKHSDSVIVSAPFYYQYHQLKLY